MIWDWQEDDKKKRQWDSMSDGYEVVPCPNCGRKRIYQNNRHVCEKCGVHETVRYETKNP